MPLRLLRSRLARTLGASGVGAGLLIAAAPSGMASAGTASPWQLARDGADRSCPVTLRFDAAGAAGALAMPAGCRRALPSLVPVRKWSIAADGSILLSDATGQAVLTFARQTDGAWHATDTDGHGFTLTPPNPAEAAADPSTIPDSLGTEPVALADPGLDAPATKQIVLDKSVIRLAAASAKTASTSDASSPAGRYAVMRGDRDTGCMVTLDSEQRSSKGVYRARLAPACRDQNISVFDPFSWQLKGSELVLTARKGHSISLDKDESGVWVKTPKDVKALGLKPL